MDSTLSPDTQDGLDAGSGDGSQALNALREQDELMQGQVLLSLAQKQQQDQQQYELDMQQAAETGLYAEDYNAPVATNSGMDTVVVIDQRHHADREQTQDAGHDASDALARGSGRSGVSDGRDFMAENPKRSEREETPFTRSSSLDRSAVSLDADNVTAHSYEHAALLDRLIDSRSSSGLETLVARDDTHGYEYALDHDL